MRIFYYFRELDTPMYWWQRTHWISELENNGHEVITFNPLDYSSIEEANEKCLERIRNTKDVDLFLTCVDQDIIYRDTILAISKMGIPTCLITWDNLELPYKHRKIATAFDLVWITSWETKYLFEKWGCKNIIFQTYAANPIAFRPNWGEAIQKIGFIGSPYGSRVNKLNDLLENEVPCCVYSNSLFQKGYNTSQGRKQKFEIADVLVKALRYMRFPIGRKVFYSTIKNKIYKHAVLQESSLSLQKEHSVSDEEMMRLYSNFALSLNITELRDTYILKNPIHKIHLRAFEIPMCGGLQFASYNEELASYFEEDKEIVLYRSKEEMLDKAKFYLDSSHSNQVMNMKVAARKRAENEHTWNKRFTKVFENLGLKV